jgi:hypothetical protein
LLTTFAVQPEHEGGSDALVTLNPAGGVRFTDPSRIPDPGLFSFVNVAVIATFVLPTGTAAGMLAEAVGLGAQFSLEPRAQMPREYGLDGVAPAGALSTSVTDSAARNESDPARTRAACMASPFDPSGRELAQTLLGALAPDKPDIPAQSALT